jgi:repressor LexA
MVDTITRYGLTPKQAETLAFLRKFIEENGYSPTFDEIGAAIGLASRSGVSRLLDGLGERGYVRRLRRGSRSIVITEKGSKHVKA